MIHCKTAEEGYNIVDGLCWSDVIMEKGPLCSGISGDIRVISGDRTCWAVGAVRAGS